MRELIIINIDTVRNIDWREGGCLVPFLHICYNMYYLFVLLTSCVPCLCTRGRSTSVKRQKHDLEDRPEPICSAMSTQFGRPSLRAVLNCSYASNKASSCFDEGGQ